MGMHSASVSGIGYDITDDVPAILDRYHIDYLSEFPEADLERLGIAFLEVDAAGSNERALLCAADTARFLDGDTDGGTVTAVKLDAGMLAECTAILDKARRALGLPSPVASPSMLHAMRVSD